MLLACALGGCMVGSTTFRARESRSLSRSRAKAMRHDPVYVERLFWSYLHDRKLGGWKFRRQVLIGPYIADYVCAQKRVIVELDGGVHRIRRELDRKRDAYLRGNGYVVLRFENSDVLRDISGVLAKILQVIGTAPPPRPLSPKDTRQCRSAQKPLLLCSPSVSVGWFCSPFSCLSLSCLTACR